MKLSVIVPAYNVEKYIERCILSILNQSLKEIEVILIDDGSSDQTRNICKKIAEIDTRLIVICQENQGVAKARNNGLTIAQGDYIIFIDSDDYIEKDCLVTVYKLACQTNADIVLWDLCNIYENGRRKYNHPIRGDERLFEKGQIAELEYMILSGQSESGESVLSLSGPVCKLIKKNLAKNCFFPENITLGEDTCYVLQLIKKCEKIKYINRYFYNRCIQSDSLSMKIDEMTAVRMSEYVNWVCEYYKEQEEKKAILNSFCYQRYQAIILDYFFSNRYKNYNEAIWNIKNYIKMTNYTIDYSKIFKRHHLRDKFLCVLIKLNFLQPIYLLCKLKNKIK